MNLPATLASLRSTEASREAHQADALQFPSQPIDGVFTDGQPARLAVHTDNCPMLLLPASSGELRMKLPACGGVDCTIVRYRVASEAFRYFIQLKCLDPALESVFMDLLENVCDRIRSGGKSSESLEAAIDDFRNLLRNRVFLVDRKKVLGLFGELVVLRETLNSHSRSVDAWVGPIGGRRDFLFPRLAIEVKASEKTDQRTVEISSLGQLTKDDVETLYLWYLRVEEDPVSGSSVSEVIQDILTKAKEKQLFESKLDKLGYSTQSREAFDAYRWRVLESQPFQIEEGFPRITKASFSGGVPIGVSAVCYASDLDTAKEFAVTAASVLKALSE